MSERRRIIIALLCFTANLETGKLPKAIKASGLIG